MQYHGTHPVRNTSLSHRDISRSDKLQPCVHLFCMLFYLCRTQPKTDDLPQNITADDLTALEETTLAVLEEWHLRSSPSSIPDTFVIIVLVSFAVNGPNITRSVPDVAMDVDKRRSVHMPVDNSNSRFLRRNITSFATTVGNKEIDKYH